MPERSPENLLNLPAVPGSGEVEELAVGEFVDEADVPGAPPSPPVRAVVVRVAAVARHPHARRTGRHAGYVAAGIVVAVRRRRKRLSLTAEMAHLAAARGELDKAVEWARQDHEHRHQRAERQRKAWEAAGHLLHPQTLKGIAITAAVVVVLLVMSGWMRYLAALYHLVSAAAAFAWDVRYGVPAAVLLWFWHLGRTADSLAPKWAQTSAAGDDDIAIDERSVTQAIANLRFPEVRDYLKAGHPMQFLVPCRTDGRGTYFEVRLPGGLTAERVVKRREGLAASLYRLPKETWPSVGSDAGILKGWIADKGALDEGAGPYPLLDGGLVDVFKGVPFGRTLRGEAARMPVIGRNSICGGAPEQGKSNSARVVACGYTLDITAELRIYIPDANFDFDWFEPRCSDYLRGAEDEVIEQMLERQELLKEEIQQRGQLLIDHQMQEVTYDIAHAGVGLHPVFILIEEAHVPIGHKKFGKDFGQLLGENVRLCRKRGMHIMVSTQAPVRGAMPRDVTVNCTVGIAHALSDGYANDALLGPGAARSGHRAMDLMIGTDRGIALCKGFGSEARSEMVQVHRIQASRGSEQVTPLVKRALTAMAEQGLQVPGTEKPLAITERDLLTDVAAVIDGPWRVNVNDLPDRLRRLAPSCGRYRGLKGKQLRGWLTDEGVKTTNTDNKPELEPAELHRVIAGRERDE